MAEPASSINIRLQRDVSGIRGAVGRIWGRWWVKLLAVFAGLLLLAYLLLWLLVARDLPSVDGLRLYEPPLPTNVRDINGTPIHSYARERRVELSYDEYPPLLVRAFLAAEDRTFFEHHGLDFPGLMRAAIQGVMTGTTPRGTSTITQQVAKNLLVGNEVSYSRKLKEAILAWRIEDTLSKQQILELYLNQIPLGRNAFGVEAASHAYFDKELDELSLAQMAYLAILPKGPANYDPFRNTARALGADRHFCVDSESGGNCRCESRNASHYAIGVSHRDGHWHRDWTCRRNFRCRCRSCGRADDRFHRSLRRRDF